MIRFLLSLSLFAMLSGCSGSGSTVTDTTGTNTTDTTTVAEPTPTPSPVYFPLNVTSPGADVLMMVGSKFTYSVTGGLPPYKFEYISGPGSIGEITGIFDAGDILGNTIIDIHDSSNLTVRVKVRAAALLKVTPETANLNVSDGIQFNISGGVPPYSFYIDSGSGFINGIGYYTSTTTPASASIKIYDSQGNMVTAHAVSKYPLRITPAVADINRGETMTFEGKDGFPPYTYSVTGGGNINSITGSFIAPAAAGSSQVKVTDSMNNSVSSTVTINSRPLGVEVQNITLQLNGRFGFKPSGGLAPYTFRLINPDESGIAPGYYCVAATSGISTPEECATALGLWKFCAREIPITMDEPDPMTDAKDVYPDEIPSLMSKLRNNADPDTYCSHLPQVAREQDLALDPAHRVWKNKLDTNGATISNKSEVDSIVLASGSVYAPAIPDKNAATRNFRVKLIDGELNSIIMNVSVNNALTICYRPTPDDLCSDHFVTTPNLIEKISAIGGVPPYNFQILTGGGTITNSINNAEGQFSAPSSTGTTVVQLRDSANTIVTATIEISPDLHIFPLNPTIGIDSNLTFIGQGGVPPYRFDIVTGPGIMNVNGTFSTDAGPIFAPQSTVVRITDGKDVKRLSTITINPAVAFAEEDIVVRSGATKIIEAINGVPPYQLKFKNGTSAVGSSIINVPDGMGGYIMQYHASNLVTDDIKEKLTITDSLNNKIDANVTIFGGLVAHYDPDKSAYLATNVALSYNAIKLTDNDATARIDRLAHGLISNNSTIRIKNALGCANFEDYDFNTRFYPDRITDDIFSIAMPRKANLTVACEMASAKYDVLTNMVSSPYCPSTGNVPLLNLRDYSATEISTSCSPNAVMFEGSCGKAPSSCASNTTYEVNPLTNTGVTSRDVYRMRLSRATVADNNIRSLNFNVPLTQDEDSFVTVEMWFKWNGDRSPETVPPTVSFNGTLIGFNNYNVSFITVLNSSGAPNKTLCFNTQISSLDCYGMASPDPIIVNRWSHLVFVFNNGDITKNKIYINGIVRSVGKQGTVDSIPRYVSSDFKIGVNYNNTSPLFRVKGDIGLVRVFDRAISDNEVLNNYNATKCLYQGVCY